MGKIAFENCGEPRLYDEAEIAILKVAADSIAAAIERQAQDDALRESEHRYRTLFELSNEGVYRYEIEPLIDTSLPVEEQLNLLYQNYRISEVNTTLLEQFQYQSAAAVVGKGLNDFDPPNSSNQAGNRAILENGYQIRNVELEGLTAENQIRYFLSNIVGDVRDGYFWGGWGMFTDITELKQTQQTLLAAEQDRTQRLQTISAIANQLLRTSDYTAVLPDVLRVLGETAGSHRCGLVQNITDPATGQPAAQMHTEWCRVGTAPSMEHTPELASALLAELFADLDQRLARGEILSFVVDKLAEPMRSLFLDQGNVTMLLVPIVVRGEFWGVFGFDYCQEVQLLDKADQAVFAIAADSIAAAIERDLNQQEREQASQQRATELAEHNRVLQGRDRILEATATAANALLTTESLEDAVNTALKIIGTSLDTDRILVAQTEPFDENSNLSLVGWQCLYEWHSPHAVSQLQHPEYSRGNYEGIEDWLEQLSNDQSLSYLLEDLPEPFRSVQAAIGLKSMHMIPFFLQGQFWGMLGIDDCREVRRRDPAELAVLKTAAACIGSAIQRDCTQKAILAAEQARSQELAQLNTELQHTLDRLATSETRFRELFEASNDNIYFLEFEPPVPLDLPTEEQIDRIYSAFHFTDVNPACEQELGLSRSEIIGSPLTVIHSPDSDGHRSLRRRMIENGWQITNAESEDTDANGQKRYWLSNLFTTREDGYVVRGWGINSNITDLRQAQDALAEERLQAETALIRERTRIAQEIHDTLAQTFTGITVQLELAQYLIAPADAETDPTPAELPAILEGISTLAQTGLAEARRSIWEIHPTTGAYNTLAADLATSLEQLTAPLNLQTQFTVTGEPQPLPYLVGQNLLRIGQEAIANVLKHAQAAHLWVELAYAPDTVSLRVKDDGGGFLPQAQTEGFGLIGMSQRVESLHGRLSILSHPHQGTEIFVQVSL